MRRILYLSLVLPVMAVDMPDRGEVDRLWAGIGERSGNGEPTLLAACAFGYAACGDAAKAEECAAEIRKRFPASQARKLIEPGVVAMPCRHCCGVPVRCARCDGKGELVTMAGSKPVKAGITRARLADLVKDVEKPLPDEIDLLSKLLETEEIWLLHGVHSISFRLPSGEPL